MIVAMAGLENFVDWANWEAERFACLSLSLKCRMMRLKVCATTPGFEEHRNYKVNQTSGFLSLQVEPRPSTPGV